MDPAGPIGVSPKKGERGPVLRILFVYDCLYPHTIGGFERYYRDLAAALALHHQVTYLTRTQWDADQRADGPAGVAVIGLNCGRKLYSASGRRRIVPPLRFGIRVLLHLVRNRRRYDIVHTCSFPYFPMLSAALAHGIGGPPVVTDWIEVWSPEYWRRYLGPIGGRIGAAVQRLCIHLTSHAFTLSELAANSLRANGYRNELVVLKGISDTSTPIPVRLERDPLVVYAGRHIPEKHVDAIPAAITIARGQIAGLRAIIFGDGPSRAKVLAEVGRLHLGNIIEFPGFVPFDEIDAAMRRAMCLILPSEREGYGSVVIEAAARGTPAIVVQGPDNAAAALIVENVNGFIAPSLESAALALTMVKAYRGGTELISRTRGWFQEHAQELSIQTSITRVEEVYRTVAR